MIADRKKERKEKMRKLLISQDEGGEALIDTDGEIEDASQEFAAGSKPKMKREQMSAAAIETSASFLSKRSTKSSDIHRGKYLKEFRRSQIESDDDEASEADDQAREALEKMNQDASYLQARRVLLGDLVPAEEKQAGCFASKCISIYG